MCAVMHLVAMVSYTEGGFTRKPFGLSLSLAVWPVGGVAHLAGDRGASLPQGVPQLSAGGPAGQPDP